MLSKNPERMVSKRSYGCMKKSVLEVLVMGIGGVFLGILILLFSFTETHLPTGLYMVLYFGCILAIRVMIARIERKA